MRVVVDVGAADADGVRGDAQLPGPADEVPGDLADVDDVLLLKDDVSLLLLFSSLTLTAKRHFL